MIRQLQFSLLKLVTFSIVTVVMTLIAYSQDEVVAFLPGDVCFIARFDKDDDIPISRPQVLQCAEVPSLAGVDSPDFEFLPTLAISRISEQQWTAIRLAVLEKLEDDESALIIFYSQKILNHVDPVSVNDEFVLGFPYNRQWRTIASLQVQADRVCRQELIPITLRPMAYQTGLSKSRNEPVLNVSFRGDSSFCRMDDLVVEEDVTAFVLTSRELFDDYRHFREIEPIMVPPNTISRNVKFALKDPVIVGFEMGDAFFASDIELMEVDSFSNGVILNYCNVPVSKDGERGKPINLVSGRTLRLQAMSDEYIANVRNSLQHFRSKLGEDDPRYVAPRIFVINSRYDISKFNLGHRFNADNKATFTSLLRGHFSCLNSTVFLDYEEELVSRIGTEPLSVKYSEGADFETIGEFDIVILGNLRLQNFSYLHPEELEYHRIGKSGKTISFGGPAFDRRNR